MSTRVDRHSVHALASPVSFISDLGMHAALKGLLFSYCARLFWLQVISAATVFIISFA